MITDAAPLILLLDVACSGASGVRPQSTWGRNRGWG